MLPLKLKESLISEFLWPRISISLLSVLKIKFFVGSCVRVCCCREMKESAQRFHDFYSSCFVSPGLSEVSQQQIFSSVSLGVSLPQASNESNVLPQKWKHTLCPLAEHQPDGKMHLCEEEVERRLLLLFA